MPNSLIPDFPITTSEMPKSSLTKADIAAPMRDMAEAVQVHSISAGPGVGSWLEAEDQAVEQVGSYFWLRQLT